MALDQGIAISWSLWALAAVVPGVVSLVVMPLVIYRLCPPGAVTSPNAHAAAKAALAGLGRITRDEKLMGSISIALLIAWILGSTIGLDVTAAGLLAVAALLLTGVLSWQDIAANAEAWNTFIWFAVLLMMATFLGEFGLIKWFTPQVASLFAGIGWVAGLLGLSFVYFFTHYFFASITAHVSAMYAPFLAVALALGAPPLLAALLLALFQQPVCQPHPLRHRAGPRHLQRRPRDALYVVARRSRRQRREYRDLAGDWRHMVAPVGSVVDGDAAPYETTKESTGEIGVKESLRSFLDRDSSVSSSRVA